MRGLFLRSKKSSSKNSAKREAFTEFDKIPIETWKEVNEKGNLDLLIISGEYTQDELRVIWTNLYDQYIEEFGVSESYLDLMNLKKDRVLLEIEFQLTGNRFTKTQMSIIDIDILNLISVKNVKFGELVAWLDTKVGFQINLFQTSAQRFYNYLKIHLNGR